MNYLRIYNNLIENAKNRKLSGYGETHHIIPTCIGGLDIPSNRVKLKSREHFIAHLLLWHIYKTDKTKCYKMGKAVRMMGWNKNGDRRLTSWEYEQVRKINSESMKMYQNEILDSGFTRAQENGKSIKNKLIRKDNFHFYHDDYGEYYSNAYDLMENFPELKLNSTNLLKVGDEKRFQHKGWRLLKNKHITNDEIHKITSNKMKNSAKNRKNKDSCVGRIYLYSPNGEIKKFVHPNSEEFKILIELGYWTKNSKYGSIPNNMKNHKNLSQSNQMKKSWILRDKEKIKTLWTCRRIFLR